MKEGEREKGQELQAEKTIRRSRQLSRCRWWEPDEMCWQVKWNKWNSSVLVLKRLLYRKYSAVNCMGHCMERHMCLRYNGKLGLILRDSNGGFHSNWSGFNIQHLRDGQQPSLEKASSLDFYQPTKSRKTEKKREMFPFIPWRLLKSQVNDFRDFLKSSTQSSLSV